MASAAPLKPVIGYQPTGAQDRWLSLWAWGYETATAHTTVHVTPLPFTRSADDAIVLKMQLFDGKVSPVAVFQSEPLRLGEHLHVPLREVLEAHVVASFDSPAQIQACMLRDPRPSESRIIETWTTPTPTMA